MSEQEVTELFSNAAWLVRRNEAAIVLLCRKLDIDPVELFDQADGAVRSLHEQGAFNAE